MDDSNNIVIVGGGFAGTAAIRHFNGRLPPGYRLILISEESYTTFHPMLPEAVGASIFPEQVVAPLREILQQGPDRQFIMGRVVNIDAQAKTVTCNTLVGAKTVPYQHLIIACGNRARTDLLPGMAEHALPLKTVGDAMDIRNTVLRRLAASELETDGAKVRALGHFVIIGGGFSGAEVAGELVDCLDSIRRFYPRMEKQNLNVTVVHDGERLLPELPPSLGAAAQRSLEQRGVAIHLNKRATSVSEAGVHFTDGSVIEGATVITTVGTRPNALLEALGLALNRGRLPVQPDMQVLDCPGLWAIGDCAQIPNAYDQDFAPATAQFAVCEGKLVAKNILASIAGQPTNAFRHQSRGMMAAIGHMRGVAEVFGIQLSGLPAWLVWRAYYLSQMPTLGRKLRIFLEWSWGMFFAVDITHLHFKRSAELDRER